MTGWPNKLKVRRFRICSICLLILIILSAYTLIHLASQPSFTVNIVSRLEFDQRTTLGISSPMVSLQVSNKMSFTVYYVIAVEAFRSNKWVNAKGSAPSFGFLPSHSQTNVFVLTTPDTARLIVLYNRQLTTTEKSIINKLPWLGRHYPIFRFRKIEIYDSTLAASNRVN